MFGDGFDPAFAYTNENFTGNLQRSTETQPNSTTLSYTQRVWSTRPYGGAGLDATYMGRPGVYLGCGGGGGSFTGPWGGSSVPFAILNGQSIGTEAEHMVLPLQPGANKLVLGGEDSTFQFNVQVDAA